MLGSVSWFEIPSKNFARAKKFYEDIFSLSLRTLQEGPEFSMAAFTDGKQMFGAVVKQNSYEPSHKGSLIYLDANPNLEKVLSRVENSGGKVLIPKRQISPEYGYMGVFEDTEGNRMALHSRE